ncbi:MAG: uroporphyrinogen-III synthase [Pseudomonadota bacterium]
MAAQQPPGLLIPRPITQGRAFAESLAPGAWTPILAPLMRIVPATAPPDLAGVTHLIFTSRNGVEAAAATIAHRLPAICVGAQTTERAKALGFAATQAGATAADLAQRLTPEPDRRLLHLHGAHVSGDLAGSLRAAGHHCDSRVIYDQHARPLPGPVLTDLAGGTLADVVLFSPRSADLFAKQTHGFGVAPGCRLYCLSDAVADRARAVAGAALRVAARPDATAMRTLLQRA